MESLLTALIGAIVFTFGSALVWKREIAAKRYREFDERSPLPSGLDQPATVALTAVVGASLALGGLVALVGALL